MKKFWFLTVVLTAIAGIVSFLPHTTSGHADKYKKSLNPIPEQYIVVLNTDYVGDAAVRPEVESEASYLSAVYGGKVHSVYADAFKGYAARMTKEQAQILSEDERVMFVEEDTLVSVSANQANAPWNLDRIDQRNMPLDTNFSYNGDGTGVHVYVIDTGVRVTHSEFGGRASFSYDSVNDGQNGNDCHGHGTHVAGTVGSATYGVAKNAYIHNVRVLPCSGQGALSQIINGVDWVKANHVKPAVANMSITVSGISPSTDLAVANAINAGVTFAIAAGNYANNACSYSPGRVTGAITVAATGTDDSRASFSNYGSCVDIFAPGAGILSLGTTDDNATRGMSGTSMASPLIAGVAAVYLQSNPFATPAQVWTAMKGQTTTGTVTNAGTDSPNLMLYSVPGLGTSPTPTPPPTATPTPAPTPRQHGQITIRKRVQNASGGSSTTEFPYTAVNIPTTSFALTDNGEFVDPEVSSIGSPITIAESPVYGWRLASVSCTETAGSVPNQQNTTVDLANSKATIVVEEGESVECTFTSQPLAPSAAVASINGRLINRRGQGLKGVYISLFNPATGTTLRAMSNSFGYYSFTDQEVANMYVLQVESTKKNLFTNNMRTFMLNDDITGLDFVSDR